jgi:hypothetical protein
VSDPSPQQRVGGWIRDRPRLENVLNRILRFFERGTKGPLFGCSMCGQCVLHSTGMVCPMTCPKQLRNGPCGGVGADGSCEVIPEWVCVWARAFDRSQRLPWSDEIHYIQPPMDWTLQGSSSWLNLLMGRDRRDSGCEAEPVSALEVLVEQGD